MGRWHCSLAGLLGIVTLFSGCATNRPGNPFASSSGQSPTAAKRAADENLEIADRKMNSRSRTPRTSDSATAGTVGQRQVAAGHDPETQAYIDQELRDATPEERATYTATLKGLHPDAVRQILHSRRLTQRAVQKQREIAAQRPDSNNAPLIQTAGTDAPAPSGPGIRRVGAGEGLGSVSAWPRQSAPADRSAPAVSFAGTIDASPPPANAAASPASGAPLGHTSGYRVDPQGDNSTANGYALVRPGVASTGRGNPAAGQPAAGQFAVSTAAGVSGPPRGSAIRPAAVSVGTAMNAGAAAPGPGTAAAPGNSATDSLAREQLARYISLVESEAFELQPGETEGDWLAYIEKQVHLRMLYLMSGQ